MKSLLIKAILTITFSCIAYIAESQQITPPNPQNSNSINARTFTEVPINLLNIKQQFAIDSDRIVTTPELKKLSIEVDSVLRVDSVTIANIKGFASIDGPVALNNKLSKGRANALSYWLRQTTAINPAIIKISSDGEDWAWFESLVEADPNCPFKSEILKISKSNSSIPQKQRTLKSLDGGKVWKYLALNIFPEMRVAELNLGGYRKIVPIVIENPQQEVVETIQEEVEETPLVEVIETPLEEPEPWIRQMYVKTNAPAWIMLWQNLALEIDIAPHWSFSVPVYWSPYNYGKQTLKFRTLSTVPEFRYWLRSDNMGFYVNTHFGVGSYNYAKGKEYRYQHHNGKTPAIGGGIGLGYRFYFCRNHHWSMEAALGFGIYQLDYDIFQNTPHTDHGYLLGRRKRTFYGIDQAAFSFCYSFGLTKKGGAK